MDLRAFKGIFLVVTAIVALLVASPALSRLLVLPQTEFFTEMWLLGPNHMAENYPFNVSGGQNYSVYLGLANHLGYTAYYVVEVKFRNETEPGPTNVTASGLPSLFNITAFVADQGVWEVPVSFGFGYGVNASVPLVSFYNVTFNDVTLDLTGLTAAWNATRSGFYGNLFFELWIYDTTQNSFQFHQRSVWLWLNMTV
jgi:uncharacterized membrane protein